MCDNLPPDVLKHICNNKLIITGAIANPDDIAIMGVDVDSMNMSDHGEFDAPQTYDLAEAMAKRLLEEIPMICGWTHHDLPSLHELVQRSMEPFDSQPTGEVKWPVRMKTMLMRVGSSPPITCLYQS